MATTPPFGFIRVRPWFATLFLAAALHWAVAWADDWPQWRGIRRDGVSAETHWTARWPESGPKVLWRMNVGTGYSAVSVQGHRVVTLGNVGGWLRAEDVVWCLNATNGQTLWRHAYASKAGSYPGPRMTPTVDGDAVYVLSRHGRLACLSRDDGAVRWQTDLHETCGVEREPYEWGLACSPTVWGDRLALDAGRLVVVHKATGALDFTLGTDRPAFSSPVVFHHGSRWLATSFNQSGLALYDLVDRSAAGRCEWRAKYAANAATPVVGDGHLFITSGYGRGCALLRVGSKGLERVYEAAAVSSECLTGVLFGGFLYAVSGDLGKRGSLRCVEFRTGAVRWNYDGFRVGGGISIAGGRILHLMDNGELAIAEATPERYSELSRAKVLEAQCRTVPVLANGRIYCRNTKGDLVCLDVRTDSTGETPSRTP